MRSMLAFAVVLSLVASSAASAQSVDATEDAAASRWVTERVRAARLGRADYVEIPLVHASLGWGCRCPPTYVGWTPDTGGSAWLSVVLAPGVTLPDVGRRGDVRMVRGYFTGNVSHFVWEEADETYIENEFVVTEVGRRAGESPRARVITGSAYSCESVVSDESPLNVRARGGARAPVVTQLANGTAVTIDQVRPDWLYLRAPAAGWVYAVNVRTTCTAQPTGT